MYFVCVLCSFALLNIKWMLLNFVQCGRAIFISGLALTSFAGFCIRVYVTNVNDNYNSEFSFFSFSLFILYVYRWFVSCICVSNVNSLDACFFLSLFGSLGCCSLYYNWFFLFVFFYFSFCYCLSQSLFATKKILNSFNFFRFLLKSDCMRLSI